MLLKRSMKDGRKKIVEKVIRLLLGSIFISIFLVGVSSLWNLNNMKRLSLENNKAIGTTAASDAKMALEEMARENLLNVAIEKSTYINEKFVEVESCVQGIASLATEIYKKPDSYPCRKVSRPRKNSNKLAAQLLQAKELKKPTKKQLKEQYKLGNIQDLLVQYNRNNNMISTTYLATETGWMIEADYNSSRKYDSKTGKQLPFDAKTREWYQKAKAVKEGQLIYTDVMRGYYANEDCIVCASPVYSKGKVVAVAGIGSYLKTVKAAVLSTKIGKNGYACLINEKGQIIASPKEGGELAVFSKKNSSLLWSNNESLKNAVNNMVKGKNDCSLVTIDGKQCYIAYAPLQSLNWSFIAVMDVQEILGPVKNIENKILYMTDEVSRQQKNTIRDMLYFLVFLLILITLIAGGAGVVLSYRITSPIRQLAEAATSIDLNDLNYAIQINTKDEVEELGNALNIMIAQIKSDLERISRVTAEKERIHMEIQVASKLQADMLPQAEHAFDNYSEFTLASFMLPAKGVGGDFYDFFLLDRDHLAIIMADVSGKGVPAALFMVVAHTILRSYVSEEISLSKAIQKTNEYLCKNGNDGMFVTAWIGVLTISTGIMAYVNAGHCMPVIKRKGGICQYEETISGLVLAGLDDTEYTESELKLEAGDTILLYTDGVTEATNIMNELYGEKRLLELMDNMEQEEPDKMLHDIWRDIFSFQGEAEQFDDVTMLALCYNGMEYQEMEGEPKLTYLDNYTKFLEEFARQYNLSEKTLVKLNIALDEIYSNICNYSNASKLKIGCRLINKSYEGRKIILRFQDNGIQYNPLKHPDPDMEELMEKDVVGGWGIYLVKQQMDNVEYEYRYVDGINVLTLTKMEEV